jgi:hypothetical protein
MGENQAQREAREAIPTMQDDIAAGRCVYLHAADPGTEAETRADLGEAVDMIAQLVGTRHIRRDVRVLITYGPREV